MKTAISGALRASVAVVLAVLSLPVTALPDVPAPALTEPADGETVWLSIPHFSWRQVFDPRPDAMPSYVIQIACDRDFNRLVDEDRLAAVITWYVPDRELAAGEYWWRVAGIDSAGRQGPWSEPRGLVVKTAPEFRIRAGATFAEIRKVIRKAAASAPARAVFEKGVYRVDPGEGGTFIDLEGASDLTIDGGGSEVVLTRPSAVAGFTDCRRVMLKGFAFDYDPLVYTAGRVIDVNPKAGTVEADILPGHPLPDEFPAYDRERKGLIVTEADGFAMKRGVPLVVEHAGFSRLEGRRFRFRFDRVRIGRLFAPGDIYVLDPRWYGVAGGTTICVCGGQDVVLYDLAIRGGANECLNSFYAERHAILHVRIERKDGRALSVNNGGNNHHNARTGPWIEGCLFENTGDDICHVNGYAMGTSSQPAPDRVILPLNQVYDQFDVRAGLGIRPGDRLEFFDRAGGRLLAERGVVSVQGGGKTLDVVLDGAVEGLVAGRLSKARDASHAALADETVTQVFDASRGCNQFVFRGNTCRNGRRVGVLAKGLGGLVEGNTFEGLGGGAVEFWNAPFEGLAARDYVVRGNTIRDCGRLAREHAAIWATIFRSGAWRGHRNILVEDNDISGCPLPAVLLRDVENAVLRGNRIQLLEPVTAETEARAIVRENTLGVTLEGNRITGP